MLMTLWSNVARLPSDKPTFYEFFAGAGLVREALEPDWQCVWANDFDSQKAAVYQENFGVEDLVVGDVALARAEDLPKRVDMAWASFPCQDLSLAGWRRGMSGQRSGTFWAFWRIMRDLYDQGDRPPLIVIENVVGLLHDADFAGLCEALTALGMNVGALVIDAKYFVPQSRPRVFVVAVDNRVRVPDLTIEKPDRSPWFTPALHRAYESLPHHVAAAWRWWKLAEPTDIVRNVIDLIDTHVSGPWHSERETLRILDLMSPVNLAKVEDKKKLGGLWVGLIYKRTRESKQRAEVRFDGVSGCLRTPKGGASRQIVLVVDNGNVRTRLLSPREAARLMGAPDSFKLPPEYNAGYKAMGDAVVVPAVRWLGQHLLISIHAATRDLSAVTNEVISTDLKESHVASRRKTQALVDQWEIAHIV